MLSKSAFLTINEQGLRKKAKSPSSTGKRSVQKTPSFIVYIVLIDNIQY
jgi:hypothetical protein